MDDFYNEALDYGICYMQSNMEHSARSCSDDAETQQGLCFAKVSFYRNETAKKCGLPQAYIYTIQYIILTFWLCSDIYKIYIIYLVLSAFHF